VDSIVYSKAMSFVVIALGTVSALVVFYVLASEHLLEQRYARTFSGQIARLADTSGLTILNVKPYLKGKGIVIDKNGNSYSITDNYRTLPDQNLATNPNDVRMVVVLDHGDDIVGSYENGSLARRDKCTLTVIDRMIPAIVDQEIFYGGAPRGNSGCLRLTLATLPTVTVQSLTPWRFRATFAVWEELQNS
jgi:hypothetical protein